MAPVKLSRGSCQKIKMEQHPVFSHPSTNYVTKILKWFVIKVFYYIDLLSKIYQIYRNLSDLSEFIGFIGIYRIYRNYRIYRKLSYLSELSDLSEFIGFIGIYRFYRNYRIVKIYRKLFANNSWDRIIRVRIIRITNNSVWHLSELSETE